MKILKAGILLMILVGGFIYADVVNFTMRYGGVVAPPETAAFYYRYYILRNAETMPDTLWSHFQITENNAVGTWTHSGSPSFLSRANGDDDNFGPLNGFVNQPGDTNICVFEYDSAAGTIDHKGFYAEIVSKVDNTISPDSARYCSLRVVANIDTSHFDIYPQLTWRKARYDTATYDPIQLNYNPILGYIIYRSASGFDGWERLVPNGGGGGGGIYNLWDDTTHIDSIVPAGSYYYAIRLVYAPTGRIINGDTLWILSKLSKNSYNTGAIGVVESGSNTTPSRLLIYPNPSCGGVRIRYVPVAKQVTPYAKIYDSSGQLVRSMTLFSTDAIWKCDDVNGIPLPAGVYMIEVHAGNEILTEKLILQR